MANCLLCNQALPNTLTLFEVVSFRAYREPAACGRCLASFRPIPRSGACPGCSRPQEGKERCTDCLRWKETVASPLIRHEAFYRYDEAMKAWLHTFKFQGDTRLARVMAPRLRAYYRNNRNAIIVPIPVSLASRERRGFNQCEELLLCAGIPYADLLVNGCDGQKQSEKNRSARMETAQPFRLKTVDFDPGQTVILFDDVYTTGRTLMHAKQLLSEAGLGKISSLSIAR